MKEVGLFIDLSSSALASLSCAITQSLCFVYQLIRLIRKMAEKPIVRSFQDMPPPGGYPRIATRKDLRPRGPSGFAIWGGVFLMSAFGFWSLSNTSRKHRLGHAENRDARMAIIPFLRAEDDVKLAQSINQLRAKEAAVMKGTDFDIDESVYTKRKVPPQL